MKKNTVLGLASLMLWVIVISFLLTALNSFRNDTVFEIGGAVHLAVMMVCFLAVGLVFFSAKGRRLYMALMIVLGCVGGMLLTWLDLPTWQEILLVCGLFLLYLAGCVAVNQRRYSKAIRKLNAAVEAYRKDRDGENILKALDECALEIPETMQIRSPEAGLITFREYLDCERFRVLGDMGHLEEREAMIERLQQETKSPEFAAWLEAQK